MRALLLALLAAIAGVVGTAAAQSSYPDRPVRVVVTASAGGGTDIVARLVAQRLEAMWGKPVVVENKAGGGGNIGAKYVVTSTPDGYTLLVSFGGVITINPFLYKSMGFDPIKDLAPVTNLATAPYVLAVNPKEVPSKTVKEFIAFAKASPHPLNWASTAKGSPDHLAGELFSMMADVKTTHVPYKGGAGALVDVIGGRIPFGMFTIPTSLSYLKSGMLVPLGVSDSKRSSLLPDVPPLADTLPGYEVLTWYGIWAPAGTPSDIVNKIQVDVKKVLEIDAVKQQLVEGGFDPVGDTPAHFEAYIKNETKKYGDIISRLGIEKN